MVRRPASGFTLLLLVLLLSVTWPGPPSAAQRPSAWSTTLAAPMKTWLPDAMVPGLSIAIIEDGRLSWQGAFGERNADTGEPVTEATVFEAASLSKPVFAYAVMKLVDKGTLDLDRPLAAYLAGADLAQVYPPAASGDVRWKTITARMVLTHSAGFPNWFNNAPMRFLFDPGQRFSYSGEGYSLLAAALTVATGRSFNELMQELVFDPLEMKASSYVWRPDYETIVTASHDLLGRRTNRSRRTRPMAGASLYTTAGDYARFLVALGDGTGLAHATWQAMTRAQIQVVDRNGTPCFSWGLGVGVNQSGTDTTLWHWGDNGDLNAYFEIIPKRRRGVAFFMNGANAHALTPLITQRVLGLATPAIATSYFRYPTLDSPVMALTRAFRARGIAAAIEVAAASAERLSAAEAPEIQRLTALAAIAAGSGDFAGARSALDFVLKHQPASTAALVALGGVQLALGDRTAMEASFQKANETLPNLESRVNSLGYTLLNAGRIDEAIAVFEYNVRRYPQSANCYDSLAEAFEKKGNRQEAIRNYAKALSMTDPDPAGSSYQALKRLLNEK